MGCFFLLLLLLLFFFHHKHALFCAPRLACVYCLYICVCVLVQFLGSFLAFSGLQIRANRSVGRPLRATTRNSCRRHIFVLAAKPVPLCCLLVGGSGGQQLAGLLLLLNWLFFVPRFCHCCFCCSPCFGCSASSSSSLSTKQTKTCHLKRVGRGADGKGERKRESQSLGERCADCAGGAASAASSSGSSVCLNFNLCHRAAPSLLPASPVATFKCQCTTSSGNIYFSPEMAANCHDSLRCQMKRAKDLPHAAHTHTAPPPIGPKNTKPVPDVSLRFHCTSRFACLSLSLAHSLTTYLAATYYSYFILLLLRSGPSPWASPTTTTTTWPRAARISNFVIVALEQGEERGVARR